MAQDEVVKRREGMKWKGQDDDHILEMLANDEKMRAVYEITHDEDDLSAITLVPQAIRTFVISYKPAEQDAFLH
jgi:hypothetical protein